MSVKIPPLHPDSKYLFEIISQKDGRKSKPFICTPTQVCDWMDNQSDDFDARTFYVNFLMDVGAANEVKTDETIAMSDLVMSVPLFSGKAFSLMFRNPEAVARFKSHSGQDLNEYDESITDADFANQEDQEDES